MACKYRADKRPRVCHNRESQDRVGITANDTPYENLTSAVATELVEGCDDYDGLSGEIGIFSSQ